MNKHLKYQAAEMRRTDRALVDSGAWTGRGKSYAPVPLILREEAGFWELLWRPKLFIRLPEEKTTSTSTKGRRYGDYFHMSVSLGHYHLCLFPAHNRRFWMSVFARNYWEKHHE